MDPPIIASFVMVCVGPHQACQSSPQLRKAIEKRNSFERGEASLGPIHKFEAHYCALKDMEFLMKIEGFGYFFALFLKGSY